MVATADKNKDSGRPDMPAYFGGAMMPSRWGQKACGLRAKSGELGKGGTGEGGKVGERTGAGAETRIWQMEET